MSFNNLDLDIENYSLDELLSLFNIPFDFSRKDLKIAKRVVLMTHPDKSGEKKEIFLFFSKAYKLIYSLYSFREKAEQDTSIEVNYEYENLNQSTEGVNDILKKFSNKKDFNFIFNKMFEKHKLEYDQDDGYGDWLKEEADVEQAHSKDDMNRIIENKKQDLRAIIVKKDIIETGIGNASGHSNLTNKRPEYYQSKMFGNLQYDDVHKAYTESVVPVTEEDYKNKKKFKNISDMQQYRKQDYTKHFKESDHDEKLKMMRDEDNKESAYRAYELAKEHEKMKTANSKWLSNLLKLTNDS